MLSLQARLSCLFICKYHEMQLLLNFRFQGFINFSKLFSLYEKFQDDYRAGREKLNSTLSGAYHNQAASFLFWLTCHTRNSLNAGPKSFPTKNSSFKALPNGKCGARNTSFYFIVKLFYSTGQSSSLDASI